MVGMSMTRKQEFPKWTQPSEQTDCNKDNEADRLEKVKYE